MAPAGEVLWVEQFARWHGDTPGGAPASRVLACRCGSGPREDAHDPGWSIPLQTPRLS